MFDEHSECGSLQGHLVKLGEYLDDYLRFSGEDAMVAPERWHSALQQPKQCRAIGS